MKKLFLPFTLVIASLFMFSCGGVNKLGRSDADAAAALKQMLEIGARQSVNSTFDQQNILTALFPDQVGKTLSSIQQLGLSRDLDEFTLTLSKASQESAERSVPIFLNAIDRLSFTDALQIVRAGGTAGTDYMKNASGAELRLAIRPVMEKALEQYHLNSMWNKIVNANLGGRVNLDLPTLMTAMVTDKMFRKMAETETEIRHNATARTTPLLQKVFASYHY